MATVRIWRCSGSPAANYSSAGAMLSTQLTSQPAGPPTPHLTWKVTPSVNAASGSSV